MYGIAGSVCLLAKQTHVLFNLSLDDNRWLIKKDKYDDSDISNPGSFQERIEGNMLI